MADTHSGSVRPDSSTIISSHSPTARPYPGLAPHWSEHTALRALGDLRLVSEVYPELREHTELPALDADIEDFWEPLVRTAAMIRAARATGKTIQRRSPDHAWTPDELAQRSGPVFTIEERKHAADPLLNLLLFRANAGRWMAMCGYSDIPGELAPHEDLVTLVLRRARAGVDRVVLKFAGRKAGVVTIGLHPEMTAEDVESALMDSDDGWTFVRIAGKKNTILLQDQIPMRYEYRLFVVDGKVVSGAGCIEEFTPYSRTEPASPFDDRMRYVRGDIAGNKNSTEPSVVTHEPELLDRYLDVGQDLAYQYKGTVVIDLALDVSTNRVVVVELNTLPNAGLYAADPDAIAMALATARDKGYGPYALKSAA